jgi:putative transposase
MIRTYQFKLYPNASQIKAFDRWLRVCCWVYNQALENRIKAFGRRGKSPTYNEQCAILALWRGRMERLRSVPSEFERDSLRRIDRGFKAFFRRLQSGSKPGFPRFKSHRRYNSLECLATRTYLRGDKIYVPCLGSIRCRGRLMPEGAQKALRIIRRATGWYAQIILDDGRKAPAAKPVKAAIGVDVGLTSLVALSNGETFDNPHWLKQSTRKLRSLQRRVSRRVKGSGRRRKAIQALRRRYEMIGDQRRSFCRQISSDLVSRFDLIAVEKLNVAGLSRSRLGKGILDAAWGTLRQQLGFKAEYAGCQLVEVSPTFTSQECPSCGAIKAKSLSERVHRCPCGCVLDRDVAAAKVILARALGGNRGLTPVEEATADIAQRAPCQVAPMKRENRKRIVRCVR